MNYVQLFRASPQLWGVLGVKRFRKQNLKKKLSHGISSFRFCSTEIEHLAANRCIPLALNTQKCISGWGSGGG